MKQSPDRALKSTKWTIIPGQGFNNAFKCVLLQLSVVADKLAFCICEVAQTDYYKVNQGPDSTTSCCQKHQDTRAGLPDVESVDSKAAAQQT
jgi:hypothetical protein